SGRIPISLAFRGCYHLWFVIMILKVRFDDGRAESCGSSWQFDGAGLSFDCEQCKRAFPLTVLTGIAFSPNQDWGTRREIMDCIGTGAISHIQGVSDLSLCSQFLYFHHCLLDGTR